MVAEGILIASVLLAQLGVFIIIFLLSLLLRKQHIKSLEGKHVVITGGSSGIGFALAKVCLSHGAYVTLIARTPSKLSQAHHILTTTLSVPSDRILLKTVDVTDAHGVHQAVKESFSWRPIDILICNAGIAVPGCFDEVPIEDLTVVMNTNVLGSLHPIHAALPLMKARSRQHPSSIVIVSSVAGLFVIPGANMYTVTKYALKGLAEVLRLELIPHRIKVNLVCPGFTETPMLDVADKVATQSRSASKITLYKRGRAVSAEKVAMMVMDSVKRGEFLVTTSMDGFIMATISRGFFPAETISRAILELLLLIPVRICSFAYMAYARTISARKVTGSEQPAAAE